MKQPDRFARAVEKVLTNYIGVSSDRMLLVEKVAIAKLLRAEHRAIVRLVKTMEAKCGQGHTFYPHTRQASSLCGMYQMACKDLLAALARRAK